MEGSRAKKQTVLQFLHENSAILSSQLMSQLILTANDTFKKIKKKGFTASEVKQHTIKIYLSFLTKIW
jgi:hypothetical protein